MDARGRRVDERAKTIRSFVAVPVTDRTVLATLSDLERGLGLGRGVKWVPAHQKHFTLKFLASVPAARILDARNAAERAAARSAPFTVTLQGLGAYPPRGPARVVWAGCRPDAGREALTVLAAAVEAEFEGAAFEREERPFSPHLTLGRVRDEGSGRAAARRLAEDAPASVPVGAVAVTEIVLFQSVLGPAGPAYAPLGRFALGG